MWQTLNYKSKTHTQTKSFHDKKSPHSLLLGYSLLENWYISDGEYRRSIYVKQDGDLTSNLSD